MKSLPLTYNKDLQEDKEGMFDTAETILISIDILAGMLQSMTVHKERMAQSTEKDFSNATELADCLANKDKGMPFRQAHEIVGKLVLECSKAGHYLQDVSFETYQAISPLIQADIYDALSSKVAVSRRNSLGGTGFESIADQLKSAKEEIQNAKSL